VMCEQATRILSGATLFTFTSRHLQAVNGFRQAIPQVSASPTAGFAATRPGNPEPRPAVPSPSRQWRRSAERPPDPARIQPARALVWRVPGGLSRGIACRSVPGPDPGKGCVPADVVVPSGIVTRSRPFISIPLNSDAGTT
jgi:hypothetical protein